MAAHSADVKSQADRLHPLFPTLEEARQHPELVYSDHLPILIEIPVPHAKPIKIISLNVLAPAAPYSGLHDSAIAGVWESSEQTIARYDRTMAGLKKAIDLHDVDVLLLQETTDPACLEKILQTHLGEEWRIEITDAQQGLISCYPINRFAMSRDNPPTFHYENQHKRHSLHLRELSSEQEIIIHNVWGAYRDFADEHEKYYKGLLATEPFAKPSIIQVIVGDSNFRVALLDPRICNIITNIIPTVFNTDKGKPTHQQFGDHAECAFMGIGGKIYQLTYKTLSFTTGKVVIDTRDPKEIPHEKDLYRPVLFLDSNRINQTTIANMTLEDYQDYLRIQLGDEQILTGLSSNTMNDQRIFFRFSPNSSVYNLLKDILKTEEGMSFYTIKSNQCFPCLFVALDKAGLIHKTLHAIQFQRRYWIDRISTHLERPSSTFFKGWSFLLESPDEQYLNQAKTDRMQELSDALEQAPLVASAEELLAIKNTWAEKINYYTINGDKVPLSNAQLMAHKRGPQSGDERPTASAALLAEMESMLNPVHAIHPNKS